MSTCVESLTQRVLNHHAVRIHANFRRLWRPSSRSSSSTSFTISHYEVLGLPVDATSAQIRKAYVALCKQYHPDAIRPSSSTEQLEAAEKFRRVVAAYECLSNETHRRAYDLKSKYQTEY